MSDDKATAIVDAGGKPARKSKDERCPTCGRGPDKRVASGGFGVAHPICGFCGYEWKDEVWGG